MQQKHEDHKDKSEIKQNKFPSLQELVLDYITQAPEWSLEIIRTDDVFIPDIQKALVKTGSFIKLLPQDMSILILTFLPVKDWYSLLFVNKQWNQVIIPAANYYLDNITDQINQIGTYDIDSSLKNLLMQVEAYAARGRRADQVQALNHLEEELRGKSNPVAKLLCYQKRIKDIRKNIEDQYSGRGGRSMYSFYSLFSSPLNSELYQIINIHHNIDESLSEQPWFKKAIFCAKLAVTHANAQLLLNALPEIDNLPPQKNDIPEPLSPHVHPFF